MIRIAIADDQKLLRQILAELLAQESSIDVVGAVENGQELLDLADTTTVDLALIDIEMPGMSGLETAERLSRVSPTTKVIILTAFAHSGYVRRAMDAGVGAFLTKDSAIEDIVRAINRVHAGSRLIDPSLAAEALMAGPNPLTQRERNVLQLALTGASTHDMAEQLCLTQGTIKNYSSSAMAKTQTKSRFRAAQVAQERGWL